MRFPTLIAAVLAVSVPLSLAQTSTDCNPTEKSCPSDTGLDQTTFTSDFTQGSSANASWSAAAYTTINYGSQGAEFTISKAGEAPTIETDFYFFFGYVEVKMKAAPGQGIVSSIVLESDDLDEIDLEFLGGNTAQVVSLSRSESVIQEAHNPAGNKLLRQGQHHNLQPRHLLLS